jgi:hypothetical protein
MHRNLFGTFQQVVKQCRSAIRAVIQAWLQRLSAARTFGLIDNSDLGGEDEFIGSLDQQTAALATSNHSGPNGAATMPARNRFHTVF